jgi:hypothetical protein
MRLPLHGISALPRAAIGVAARVTRRAPRHARRRWRRAAVGLALLLAMLLAGSGCASAPADPDADVRADPQARAERIAGLRASIARDHAVLEELIARPRSANETPAHTDPRIREIAARLTDRTRRLERLEADTAPVR